MPSKFGTDARMAGSARSSTRMHGKHFWKSTGKLTVAPLEGLRVLRLRVYSEEGWSRAKTLDSAMIM